MSERNLGGTATRISACSADVRHLQSGTDSNTPRAAAVIESEQRGGTVP